MSWEKEPLLIKSKLYFGKAFECDSSEPDFGLWCSLGLELLARAAIASISPTLLALSDSKQKNLLYALNLENPSDPKSISATLLYDLCVKLITDFTIDDQTICLALTNRRNEELHSGSAAFESYKTAVWIAGFYQVCDKLSKFMGVNLEFIFEEDNANSAKDILKSTKENVKKEVLKLIQSYKDVFESKTQEEQAQLKQDAINEGNILAYQNYHRVDCPACNSMAFVQGNIFGKEHIEIGDDEIIVRQSVSPNNFKCNACGLKLNGYAELIEAKVGDHYTRTSTYTPEDYYGLVHPDDIDSYYKYHADYREYDNE